MQDTADAEFMQRALTLAARGAAKGEVPVGAVLVENGQIIGEGMNSPIALHDATAHAEINAIRQAGQNRQNYRLPNTTLYVTLEPCAMCAGAIIHSRIQRVVIAAPEPRAGAAGSVFNLLQESAMNHSCTVEFGLERESSAKLLKSFFKSRR